jgi:hypothetical protein
MARWEVLELEAVLAQAFGEASIPKWWPETLTQPQERGTAYRRSDAAGW